MPRLIPFFLYFAAATASFAVERPPNAVLFLVDDMGYADVGVYGNTYHRTPRIDRLAAEGMRFTAAYAAAPNCSPTRASILTGKWPARLGVTQYLPGNRLPYAKRLQPDLPAGLPLEETILPQPLAKAGYASASIGKWHLGGGEYLPERRGFDLNFGGMHWGSHDTMFAPHPRLPIPGAQPGDHLTGRLAREAAAFIERNRERPFLLYFPFYAVHSPIEGKPELMEAYRRRTDPSGRNNRAYAAMVEAVDQAVGTVLDTVRALGLEQDTIVIFFSDNGGVESRAFNGGFRRGKGWLYEGGIREPLIVKWPKTVEPGSVCATPVSSIDFYPSILEMTGAADLPGHKADGVSLVPLLRQEGGWSRGTLHWHYPHYSNAGSPPASAIRDGDWKLIEWFEDGRLELFNLANDPGEQTDLASAQPGKARELHGKLSAWRESVGAKEAPPNPDYDPERAGVKLSAED